MSHSVLKARTFMSNIKNELDSLQQNKMEGLEKRLPF